MKSLTDILTSHSLRPYVDRVHRLTALNNLWAEVMREWTEHTTVANYEEGILTLLVTNGAWATRLRYALPKIKLELLNYPDFNKLKIIQYKIDCR